MAHYPGFIRGSDTRRSTTFNTERTINWYPESGTAVTKSSGALLPTPGLVPYVYLSGPVRALFYEDGRCFAVSGPFFYEIFASHTKVFRGTVGLDSRPATISSNVAAEGDASRQLLVTSAGNGFIFDLETNTLTQITDDAFPERVVQGLFFDGYFIVLDDTGTFYLSELGNGLEWNGLDFGQQSQTSDKTISIFKTNDNLFLFGTKYTAPWYNSGAASFPFQPVQGSIMQQGTAAPFSAVEIDNSLIWLGRNADGYGIVWRANGYTPTRISHEGIENYLRAAPRLSDAVAFAYQQGGHLFYWLYVPGLETSLVYDVATELWHERAEWNPDKGIWIPHRARCHAFAFDNLNLVGDRLSGGIYELSLEAYEDEVWVTP